MEVNNYTIPKPKLSPVLYLLAAVILIGLVALFMAARYAFSRVGHGEAQSIFSALLIEFGMIVDCVVVMRSNNVKKSWPAFLGLLVSMLVSGTYNYIQAKAGGARNGISDGWQLTALAVGPLSALMFLSLAVGRELRDHESRVANWESNRQQWIDDWAEKARAEQEERETRARVDQEGREDRVRRAQADQELRLHQAELDAKIKMERMQLRAQKRKAQFPELPAVETVSGNPGNVAESADKKQRVLEFFRQHPESSRRAAAGELSMSHTYVNNLLKELEIAGKVRLNGKVEVI